jgi:hypothetical protein
MAAFTPVRIRRQRPPDAAGLKDANWSFTSSRMMIRMFMDAGEAAKEIDFAFVLRNRKKTMRRQVRDSEG